MPGQGQNVWFERKTGDRWSAAVLVMMLSGLQKDINEKLHVVSWNQSGNTQESKHKVQHVNHWTQSSLRNDEKDPKVKHTQVGGMKQVR